MKNRFICLFALPLLSLTACSSSNDVTFSLDVSSISEVSVSRVMRENDGYYSKPLITYRAGEINDLLSDATTCFNGEYHHSANSLPMAGSVRAYTDCSLTLHDIGKPVFMVSILTEDFSIYCGLERVDETNHDSKLCDFFLFRGKTGFEPNSKGIGEDLTPIYAIADKFNSAIKTNYQLSESVSEEEIADFLFPYSNPFRS